MSIIGLGWRDSLTARGLVTAPFILAVVVASVAVTLNDPFPLPVTAPADVTLATAVGIVDQFTCDVTSCAAPLEYVAIALSCCVVPSGMERLLGVIVKLGAVVPAGCSDEDVGFELTPHPMAAHSINTNPT